MAKFNNMDFDLCGGMTDREFRDTLGALSSFVIYEDANGVHNGGVKASSGLFYNGSLSAKNPTSIWAIGAGVTDFYQLCFEKTSLVSLFGKDWDTSKILSFNQAFKGCSGLTFVDCANWDVSAVTDMMAAFWQCTSLVSLDLSNWNLASISDFRNIARECTSLKSLGLPTIPTGTNCLYFTEYDTALTDVYFGEGCKTYVSLGFGQCPLTYQSVINVFNALADTPDTGATITFKSGLYAAFTEEQKAVIDEKRAAAVTNGWAIVNMGGA